ncbi:MAG: penicillin-binding protein 2 [Chloroflexota bacterium]|nr:penicillin-binding protein 2 [Aggregatilineaceae bacterium]
MGRDEKFFRRLIVVAFFMLAISAILIVRLLSFQFRMDPMVKQRLETQAENRYIQTVEVYPNRGQIYDRNGNLLAVNSFEYRVGISPNQVLDRAETARQLAPLLGVPEDEIYRKLQPGLDGKLATYALLKPVVGFEAGQAIMDLELPGMVIEPLPTRIYPQGELTAQLVGIFRDSDASKTRRGYWGVEGFYQSLLAGQSKRVTTSTIPVLQDAATAKSVRDGIDLVLTIDRDLQFLAQDVLNRAVEREAATGGTILIMNPRTGEILAMANYPMFDPDSLTPENMQRARNPAVTDMYEPGSVFKVLTMAMALQAGTHDETWTYNDPGCFNPAGSRICNWDGASHGNQTFVDVFVNSWNTGTTTIFMQMAEQLGGPYAVYDLLKEFGIGSPTGVDLEGEAPGILPEPGDLDWNEAQYLTTSFGQGVAITPLQMLAATNAIANDGLIMQPHIVKMRIDGDQVIETRPAATHRPISAEVARRARDIMVQIVEDPASLDQYEFKNFKVAGKTGTAQIPIPGGYDPNGSIASFVGFLPADDPVVSVLVKLDRPVNYWGSMAAAPVFQELVERLVVLMEIPNDSERFQLIAQGGDPFNREY